ncbi:MAG: arsenate reductase (glutaredoxin) [Bacteroidales bacterium]|nr:arsenate reductase (glutaredoxin) [Bacteroidales bacterium]MCB8998576.1 arsenate reductase (glutaredoxin) [Bacteroidales bacterium]MCB9012556.1 arsenate reductase (glutaredoxin) [Bacteroidales bacterium]
MTYKIYHNPRCRKSRAGLAYLQEKAVNFELQEYLKNGISIDELKEIVLKLNIPPKELVRKNEDLFKKELKNLEMNDEEWIKVISENPVLLRRPIIIGKHKAVIGDPPSAIDKIL